MKNFVISMPTARHRGGWVFLSLASIWAGFVFFHFFLHLDKTFPFWGLLFEADHYPLAPNSQVMQVWGQSLGILLTTLLVAGVTVVLGRRFRIFLSLELSDSWIRAGVDFGLGTLVLGFFWIGTGLGGLWYPPLWEGIASVVVLVFLWDVFKFCQKTSFPSWDEVKSLGIGYGFLCFLGGVYILLTLLVNLTPETFYDSMVYHLAVPEYWLFHHGLSDFSTNFFSNFPYGAETYFLNGLVFQGTESAKMLHVVSFVVCAFFAGGWARELGGSKAGFLALGLLLTLPLLALNTWTTQVEGFLTLAVILFLYTLTRWAQSQTFHWAFVSGLFAGLTMATKYNGVIVMGSAFLVLAIQNRRFYAGGRWKQWVLFGIAFLLVAGPWILKNEVYTGNPIFPYLMSWFHGRHLPLAGYQQLLAEQHGRMTEYWWEWFLLPWKLVMANPDSYGFAGPVALALFPLLFLYKFKHPTLRFLVWVCLIAGVASLWITNILRFMVPDFAIFYVLLAAVLAGGDKPGWGKAAAWVAGFSALLCFGYLADIVHYYYDFSGIVSGRQTRAQYLSDAQRLTSYDSMAQWLSAHLPADKRLLIVGDARGLYYEQPFLTNTVFDTQTLAQIAREEKDPQGIARRLKELGVDYLVVNGLEGIRVAKDYHLYDLTSDQWHHLDEFIQQGTELMYSQNLQAVYGLVSPLKEKPTAETMDWMLFFSPSASQFLIDIEKKDWEAAQEDLNQTVELYPFSRFWKKQKADFEKSTGGIF